MSGVYTKFMCELPMAVAWSSFGGVAIRYVLPVCEWRRIYTMTTKRRREKAYTQSGPPEAAPEGDELISTIAM